MIRNFLLICLLGCGISLATAGNPPFFTTGTAVNEKGELLICLLYTSPSPRD